MTLFTRKSLFVILATVPLYLFTVTGCIATDSSKANTQETPVVEKQELSFKPFLRVAEIDGDWSSVNEVAFAIAKYIDETDESTVAKIGAKTDWTITGENQDLKKKVLGVPLPSKKKLRLIELCNHDYAKLVMEAGSYHAPALPCEIAVHSKDGKIYIDILNPEIIFGLFFADASAEVRAKIADVPSDVKSEIRAIVKESIKDRSGYKELFEAMGPVHKAESFEKLFKEKEPLIVVNYTSPNRESFSQEDIDQVTHSILNSVLIHGHKVESPKAHYNGLGIELSSYDWISARHEGIHIPGGTKIIEFCSPKYAKIAMSTGIHHATALPCEVAITTSKDKKHLQISFLNPKYMFGTLFEDALSQMSADDMKSFGTLPDKVLSDLKKIVNVGLNSSNLNLQEVAK